ncbi:hypothetical protein BwSF12_78910 [Bradyrhizobium ottawaense]|nr:hypothetical protein BwSF12_78910 [Bradyrhizobium ottawaense]
MRIQPLLNLSRKRARGLTAVVVVTSSNLSSTYAANVARSFFVSSSASTPSTDTGRLIR